MAELTLDGIKKLLDCQTEQIDNGMNRSLAKINNKLCKNEEQIDNVQKQCLFLERKVRKNNIIIFGLDIKDENLVEKVISSLNNLLDLKVTTSEINNVYKIGKNNKPPIVVEFVSFLKKKEIFNIPEKLKSLKGTNVSISNDLCQEDRQNNKVLLKHLKIARSENKEAKIKGNKIEISNILYTAKELEEETDVEVSEVEEILCESGVRRKWPEK